MQRENKRHSKIAQHIHRKRSYLPVTGDSSRWVVPICIPLRIVQCTMCLEPELLQVVLFSGLHMRPAGPYGFAWGDEGHGEPLASPVPALPQSCWRMDRDRTSWRTSSYREVTSFSSLSDGPYCIPLKVSAYVGGWHEETVEWRTAALKKSVHWGIMH